jgi:glycerophosphoryl diester phosphodiesterase
MQIVMNKPLSFPALAGSVWRDFLGSRRALFVFDLLFKLAEAWLLVPVVALVLAAVLFGAGHIAVSNRDILDFLLTPLGLVYAALFGIIAVALLLFEQAGIMVLAAPTGAAGRPPLKQLLPVAITKMARLVQLGAIKLVLLALTFFPFVLLAALTYVIFLSQHDIYYYWKDRPPVFWVASGIGVLLLIAALAAGMFLYVRWAFALPIMLFENQLARAALRASRERVRGVSWRVGSLLLGWQLGALLLGLVLEAGFRLFAGVVLEKAGERPIVLLVLLLLAKGALLATWSFVAVVGQGLLTRRLYLWRSEQLGLFGPDGSGTGPDTEKPAPPWSWRLACLFIPMFLLPPLALWVSLAGYLEPRPPVRVTAHRGHSRAAPENTLSAIRKAIASGADYAEMDAQQTADRAVVLLHDRDLKRVAGDPRRIEDLTFDEVRKLDVGSWFGPAFAGERVPTLTEVIHLSRGRIRLNVELKFHGPNRRLAREVARILHEEDFESECIVTSFSYEALLEVKRHNPRLRTGLIVAHALGDVSRLEVEVLCIRAAGLSDDVVRAAHRLGMEIHVWTVNDAREMARLIKRGVDNIITSDPDLAIRARDEWASLTGTERLVLASRLLLGLPP